MPRERHHIVNLVERESDIGIPRAAKLLFSSSCCRFRSSADRKSDLYTAELDAFSLIAASHSRSRLASARLAPPAAGAAALLLLLADGKWAAGASAAGPAAWLPIVCCSAAAEHAAPALAASAIAECPAAAVPPASLFIFFFALAAARRTSCRVSSTWRSSSVGLRLTMSSPEHGVSVTGHAFAPTALSARSDTTCPDDRMNTNGRRPFIGVPATGQTNGTSASSEAWPPLTPSPL
mmetsp:Transcript_2700/g.9051  ORF Transcript_2700/g.9051 Transcript_2700/m.9051 type:complete len:236 (-) Transcript_2700:613-1320(-)